MLLHSRNCGLHWGLGLFSFVKKERLRKERGTQDKVAPNGDFLIHVSGKTEGDSGSLSYRDTVLFEASVHVAPKSSPMLPVVHVHVRKHLWDSSFSPDWSK